MDTRPAANTAQMQEPIRHFCGSHEDIAGGLRQLQELPALAEALERARSIAAATLRLFDEVVLEHHADEEQELFVAVVRSCRDARESNRARELVDRLTMEHRRIEQMWQRLRPAVVLTAAGKVAHAPALDDQVRDLVMAYSAHARFEEEQFLPLADAVLGRNANHMAALGVSLHLRHAPAPRAPYI